MMRQRHKQNQSPILTALQRVREPDNGQTDYGQTDREESFAECFALARADPQALRRIYPALADWFASEEHLQSVRSVLRHSPYATSRALRGLFCADFSTEIRLSARLPMVRGTHSLMTQAADRDAIEVVLEGQVRSIGAHSVRRVLPAIGRRSVGPFVFLDHMGPQTLHPDEGFDVLPHPHIGLATVTYLFEGEGLHRDSLGSEQVIRPGELNWMSAGRGIVHSERSPDSFRERGGTLHGLQFWVALPKEQEESAPTFQHVPRSQIETLNIAGVDVSLIAGTAYGSRAAVSVLSPLFLVEAHLCEAEQLVLPDEHVQRAVYVIAGSVALHGRSVSSGTLVAVAPGPCTLSSLSRAHIVLLGGSPLPEPRHMRWNFVSSSVARLDQAEADWRAGRFPRIPHDPGQPIAMP